MRTLRDIDILGDASLQQQMVRWSLVVFIATVATAFSAYVAEAPSLASLGRSLLLAAVASLVVLPVHELIHAAAFKLLGGPDVHVSFGHQDAFLYTRTNDAVLPRSSFVTVLLAPAVILTLLLVGGGLLLQDAALGILAAGLHLSGCTGDLLMASLIRAAPGCTHVQDTETGCRLLAHE